MDDDISVYKYNSIIKCLADVGGKNVKPKTPTIRQISLGTPLFENEDPKETENFVEESMIVDRQGNIIG